MSFVAFKRDILEAFDGEAVKITVTRIERAFYVRLKTFDDTYSVCACTHDAAAPDRAARRAWALALFKDFVEGVAEDRKAEAAEALHQRFGATVQ